MKICKYLYGTVAAIVATNGVRPAPTPAPTFPAVVGKFLAEKWGGGYFGPTLGHNP